MKKIRFSEEEKKTWIKYFTKYFHIKNKTSKSIMSEELYRMFDEYYTKYLELEKMKKDIVESLMY